MAFLSLLRRLGSFFYRGTSMRRLFKFIALVLSIDFFSCSSTQQQTQVIAAGARWDPFLDTLQERTLRFFLETTDSTTGLALDRWPSKSPSSVAAVGFALTSYPIAVERGIITRASAARRTLNTLRFLLQLPQSDRPDSVGGWKGFFYHFLAVPDGTRTWKCELSTIDTALLLAGVLFAQTYFDGSSSDEVPIRTIGDSLYRRVDWQWAMGKTRGVVMGWKPEEGFHSWIWRGYNEAMILYILALGSPTYPVPPSVWDAWTEPYLWAKYYGQEHLNFMPLFGHQYSQCWIDFRGIKDAYMHGKGIDYFENSRRATYVHRAYGQKNPYHWSDYSDTIWGWTACDGPKDTTFVVDGIERQFRSYSARGTGADEHLDDGTIAPTATGGSLPFAPEICIPALKAMRTKYDTLLFKKYGFVDAFNPTFRTAQYPHGWFDRDYLGIDQGPIAVMIENLRNEFVWNVMKKNRYIVKGLKRAGFTGGWLNTADDGQK